MANQLKETTAKKEKFLSRWIDKALLGTYNHFLSLFPVKESPLAAILGRLLFSKTAINTDKAELLNELRQKGIIVYASKRSSKLEFLMCCTQYGKRGLPAPELGIGIKIVSLQPASRIARALLAQACYFFKNFSFLNPYKTKYFESELKNGRVGFFALFGRRTFYPKLIRSKTNPTQELIRIQKETEKPIFIVPQVLFYSKRPLKTRPGLLDFLFGGFTKQPGRLRRIFTLLYKPKNTFVEFCDPINLQEFLEDEENRRLREENQALALRRLITSRINTLRQRVTGPILKSREEIKEAVMGSRRLQLFIEEMAAETGKPVNELSREAYEYLDEIAANYSMNWIMVYDVVLTWMLKHIFDGMVVDTENLSRLKQMVQDKRVPFIFVPTHKSHLDYLVLSYVLYYNNIACPHIAAGKNLSFWPLGPIFRGGGAFFMRRTFKGQKLYSKVFFEYIYRILQEGFNIEFFLEGGRSRTGKMLTPKTGLLSIILDAYAQGASEDLVFVPVNIGYDRIIEEDSYIKEVKGGEKESESLPQLIKARKTLKSRYGKVYLNFNEPLSIRDYLDKNRINISALDDEARREFIKKLSIELVQRIDSVTTVTPYGLVSCAILTCPRKRFTSGYLMSIMETYLSYLQCRKVKLADTITANHLSAFKNALDSFVSRKLIEHFDIDSDRENPLFTINENKRPTMEYYKNTCICFFVPASFSSLALLEAETFMFKPEDLLKGFDFIRDLFRNEFVLDVDAPSIKFIDETVAAFMEGGIVVAGDEPGSYSLTPEGLKKLKLFAAFMAPYLESYLIAVRYLKQKKEDAGENAADEKEELKNLLAHGRKMFKNNEIERLEAVSKLTLKNAYHFFMQEQVVSGSDKTKADFYEDKILNYLMLLS